MKIMTNFVMEALIIVPESLSVLQLFHRGCANLWQNRERDGDYDEVMEIKDSHATNETACGRKWVYRKTYLKIWVKFGSANVFKSCWEIFTCFGDWLKFKKCFAMHIIIPHVDIFLLTFRDLFYTCRICTYV